MTFFLRSLWARSWSSANLSFSLKPPMETKMSFLTKMLNPERKGFSVDLDISRIRLKIVDIILVERDFESGFIQVVKNLQLLFSRR